MVHETATTITVADGGEELFGDNMEQDYRPMPGLDRYDPGTQFNRNISWVELSHVHLVLF